VGGGNAPGLYCEAETLCVTVCTAAEVHTQKIVKMK